MSASFDRGLTDDQLALMRSLHGDKIPASDHKIALFEKIDQEEIQQLSDKIGQAIKYEPNDLGEIKTMSDGSQYKVTKTGWVKLENQK